MTKFIKLKKEIIPCEGYMLVGLDNQDLFEELAEKFSPLEGMVIKKITQRVFSEKISIS